MKILFVTLPVPSHLSTWYPYLSVAYLSSYLKTHYDPSVETHLVDGAQGENIPLAVRTHDPDLIGITATTLGFTYVIETAQNLRTFYEGAIVVGGPHITTLPESLPSTIDIGVMGEGEQTFLELVESYDNTGMFEFDTLGICYHDNGDVVVTPPRASITPLDKIPMPDRDLYQMEKYYLQPTNHFPNEHGRGTNIMTSRGCPYSCVFCVSCRLFSHRVRFHSADYVCDEMTLLIEKYRVEYLNIFDDIFHVSKKRLRALVKEIRKRGIHEQVGFGIQAHAGLIDDESCKLMKRMNMVYLGFGFESGSPKILKYLKNGVVTVDDNRKAVKLARKYGIRVGSGFLYAVPGETPEDLRMTADFIAENKLDIYCYYHLTPYPGTPLWQHYLDEGRVSNDMDWSTLNQFQDWPGK